MSIPFKTCYQEEMFIEDHLWHKNQQQHQTLLRYFAIPVKEDQQRLWLAIDNLNNIAACDAFAFLSGKNIEPILVPTEVLKGLLQALEPQSLKVEETVLEYTNMAIPQDFSEQGDEPTIRLLDNIFEQALTQNASDIHFEPLPDHLQVRFRIDGVLQVQPPINITLTSRIISRLKLLAKLDISETRLPQDGRFQFKTTFADMLDFRVSTLATHLGEKIVLRLQQNKPVDLSFSELGMEKSQQQQFEQALNQPQGLILVTGPTGSGKSITLYTALQHLNTTSKHIMTAEDPIEIELEGIIQTQVHTQIGLDFSTLLRTFLRQDPDIIMLGEIRDEESAEMALRAAQTGHLVLSTLHTNDAKSAISRLLQLGIKQHEIDHSLLLVIAQRLVRKCCPKCGQNEKNFQKCDCYQGYRGRIGIYQFLHPIWNGQKWKYQTDFDSLHHAAQIKLQQNLTDEAELQRVLGKIQ
ncbi:GspE/PulE family protein [Mannheimia massilioguelmaensis]|uniref:GspE/PulE family protein n=1 Tax=Mannheimia massilioguelmaensis TaxID=1604354 RepID=UPI0005C8B874|nr:GspE/PulE family protein [Mannheimia massilioguelmaensis]